jgi:hypothetical protein
MQLSCAGFNKPSVVHLLEEEVSKFTGFLLTANDDLAELDWYDGFSKYLEILMRF